MLSKNQIKLINSLQQKKYRNNTGLFIVEGEKSVDEFLASHFELEYIFYLEEESKKKPRFKNQDTSKHYQVSYYELQKISALKNANTVLAVFHLPKPFKIIDKGLILVLDNIKDPGNLGTIIRLCDWFGVQQLVCSLETVDCYNPKVVQASMGSLTRVHVVYTNLEEYLSATSLPIYISLLEGENVYQTALTDSAILVMGNEANGISKTIQHFGKHQLNIPHFSKTAQTESLNVAMATAVLLSEFRR